nr:hypothetical protein [uncultured Chitinophaga sp.]
MINRLAVYIVAHQDDWQLFMDPHISLDIMDDACRTVIIHTTAGDAGEDERYWLAREFAALSSLQFRVSGNAGVPDEAKIINVNNKRVHRVSISNCACYFLRLPDGGMYGEGFAAYGFQSMEKLRAGNRTAICSVDGVNSYSSFAEISRLINDIILHEQHTCGVATTNAVRLCFPEFNSTISTNDHNDHFNTALLVQGMDIYSIAGKYAFVHYDIQHLADDLVGNDLFWKVGMFSVYHQAVLNRHGHSTISETPEYAIWCRKDAVCREVP